MFLTVSPGGPTPPRGPSNPMSPCQQEEALQLLANYWLLELLITHNNCWAKQMQNSIKIQWFNVNVFKLIIYL